MNNSTALIRAKAPLRISFAGGGIDVPPFRQTDGGCVLSATINQYAYGTLKPRADTQICIHSRDHGIIVTYNAENAPPFDGRLDLVKAAISKLMDGKRQGFDLFLHSDAPLDSGLGSSPALMVVLVGLLREFMHLPLTDYEVADFAALIERQDRNAPHGAQDQYATVLGGINFIECMPDGVVVNPLKMSPDIINELQYNLLMCYTGKLQVARQVGHHQVYQYHYTRREEKTLQVLRELKDLTIEMKNALLRQQLDEFGTLLHYEWLHKKMLSSNISSPALDDLYDMALRTGAKGGKIIGASADGYMLLYCQYESKHKIAEYMRQAGCTIHDINFAPYGLQTWRVNHG